MNDETQKSISELAEAHFVAAERVRAMGMMNIPGDFEERKSLAVAYAEALAGETRAKRALDDAIRNA